MLDSVKSDGVYNYTYDNEGNLATQTQISTGTVTYYTWDYRNHLTQVQVKDSLGNVLNTEKFTYDVDNNRIGVSLNGVQQLYTVYDGANPYMDFNGSGQLTQRYLTDPRTLNLFYGQVSATGTVQWFLMDNLGSIRQVISSSGSSLDAITYDPYGGILSQTNATNTPRFLYAGGAYDPITGNYLDTERYYGPTEGRFLSQDPAGFDGGDANLYRYVFNAPATYVDPTGMGAWTRFVGGLQFIGGVAESLAGGALIIFPEPTLTKIGGVLIAAHGIDNALAGWNQMLSGKETQSYTSRLLTKYHKATGMNHNAAVQWAEMENTYISIVGTAGAQHVLKTLPAASGRVATRELRTIAPTAPGVGEMAVQPPGFCTVGRVPLEGWHPALRINGRVYVGHMHIQAQELAGTPFVQGRDLYGRVRLDATGRVVEVQWGQ